MPDNIAPTSTGNVGAPAASAAPATPDPTIRNFTVNGKPLTVQTGTVKAGNDKGKPVFRFLPGGAPDAKPSLGGVLAILSTLGISEDVAPILDRELLRDLAKEISVRIRVVDAAGVYSFNESLIAGAVKAVLAEHLETRSERERLKEELATLSGEQTQLINEISKAVNNGLDIRTAEFKPLTARASQLTIRVDDINKKLAELAKKAAKKVAAPVAAPVVATK